MNLCGFEVGLERPLFLIAGPDTLESEQLCLDVAGKQILERTIVEFTKAAGTVIWINHDIAQVGEIADALTYIDRKVLLDGAPREALASGVAAHLFPTLAPYLLPHVVPHIHERFPNLELLLVEEKTEEVLRRLRDGRLDVGVLALPVNDAGLHQEPLFEEDFVLAAELAGCGRPRIILRHMVPTFLSHIIATSTLAIPAMIINETSLSFLGLGIRPPAISWGVLLQEAQNIQTLALAPWLLIPGLVVIVSVLAFNLVGDGLRDAADPYSH